MRIQLRLSGRRLNEADKAPPVAANDDEPFDPPPARALRAPVLAGATMIAARGVPQAAVLRAA